MMQSSILLFNKNDNDENRHLIRVWELTANSTRYEKLMAIETNHVLEMMWIGWAILAFIGAFSAGSLFLAIVSSKSARTNPFNYYLLTLTVPDLLFNIWCGITCSMNASKDKYWSEKMCKFQGFYCVFAIGSSLWIGAVIAYEIHKMLLFSRGRRRYFPPTLQKITIQALFVYISCSMMGLLGIFDRSGIPLHYRASGGGAACVPLEIDTPSTIFFWAFVIPIYAGLPLFYVLFVAGDISVRKLLPSDGRRRLLALYFFKLLLLFSLAWLPFVVLVHAAGPYLPIWVLWTAGAVSHLQSALSVMTAMLKPDVRRAVYRVWSLQICCSPEDTHPVGDDDRSSFDIRRSFRAARMSSVHLSLSDISRQFQPQEDHDKDHPLELRNNEHNDVESSRTDPPSDRDNLSPNATELEDGGTGGDTELSPRKTLPSCDKMLVGTERVRIDL